MSSDKPTRSFARTVYYSASQALRRHATGGNILIFATVLAMIVANLPATADYYSSFWNQEVRLQIGDFNLFSHHGEPMTLLAFINDALMAVFFFVIGLEIKREILVGELSSFRQALLPILAAIGGMIVPVVIFTSLSTGTNYSGGAAIPMATDIAFSLGVLAMLGKRVPVSLKIFLTTLAVVDDIGGIIVIATCYSGEINAWMLVGALILLGLLAVYRTSIQSMQNGRAPFLACMIELVMRLAATVWLSSFIGYTAVCIASPLAWFGACALLIPCYYKMMGFRQHPAQTV